MKIVVFLIAFIGCLVVASQSLAAAAKTEAGKKAGAVATSHNFEDLLVQGKFHFSDESVTTVEDDKVLDALIGVRSDFKDRLKKSTARK